MSKSLRRFVLVAAATALIAGCGSDKTNNCPGASSLVETSVATVFVPGKSQDTGNILYTVEVTGVQASCSVDKLALNSSSDVVISFKATRAPNGSSATYKVPYFVAISQEDRILAKKIFQTQFSFEPGQMTTTFTDDIDSADIVAGKDKKTFDYLILVGLQLTKEQYDYNRASGRLNP